MMSRKHFKALAAIVVKMNAEGYLSIDAHKRLVSDLGEFGMEANSKFDRFKFNQACGLEINNKGMWQLAENIS